MNEVYKAMQALQCVWHQVNNYRVLCQWKYTSGLPPAALTKPSAAAATSPSLAALAQLNPLYPQYQHLLPQVAATTNGTTTKTQQGHGRRTLGAQVRNCCMFSYYPMGLMREYSLFLIIDPCYGLVDNSYDDAG